MGGRTTASPRPAASCGPFSRSAMHPCLAHWCVAPCLDLCRRVPTAGANPLGPTQVTTGVENPATTPGTPPEVYANDPELLAAALRDFGIAMSSIQSALVTNATDAVTGDD